MCKLKDCSNVATITPVDNSIESQFGNASSDCSSDVDDLEDMEENTDWDADVDLDEVDQKYIEEEEVENVVNIMHC
jgi:hypothetical protein